MDNVNFNLEGNDHKLVIQIARRAVKLSLTQDFLMTQMDVTACHLNGNELKLQELLDSDNFNFSHDIVGIRNNINTENGQLLNCFLPRFTK